MLTQLFNKRKLGLGAFKLQNQQTKHQKSNSVVYLKSCLTPMVTIHFYCVEKSSLDMLEHRGIDTQV